MINLAQKTIRPSQPGKVAKPATRFIINRAQQTIRPSEPGKPARARLVAIPNTAALVSALNNFCVRNTSAQPTYVHPTYVPPVSATANYHPYPIIAPPPPPTPLEIPRPACSPAVIEAFWKSTVTVSKF